MDGNGKSRHPEMDVEKAGNSIETKNGDHPDRIQGAIRSARDPPEVAI